MASNSDGSTFNQVISADSSGYEAAWQRAVTAARTGSASMQSHYDRVNGAVSAVTAQIGRLALGVTVGAGAMAVAVRHAINYQDEMGKGAQKAGVSTEQLSSMAYAAKLADVSTEELTKTYAKLSGTLTDAQQGQKQAVELFQRLKLDPKAFKDADELLLALAERFADMPDGAEKTALAIDVLGEKLGPRLIPFLNAGRAGLSELREEAQRLGVVVSTETAKQAEELNDNVTRLGVAATGAANEVAKELVPSLVQASGFFVKATKEAGLFEGVLISIGALMAKALGIDDSGKLKSQISSLKDESERLRLVLVGVDNVLAREPGNEMAQRRSRVLTARVAEVNAQVMKLSVELARLESGAGNAGAGRGFVNPASATGSPFRPGAKPGETKPEQSMMAHYKEALEQEKLLAARQDATREYSKGQELAYWQQLLGSARLGAKDRLEISRMVATLEVQILQQQARDAARVNDVQLASWRDTALARVDMDAEAARNRAALGEISAAQLLAQEAAFEEQRYQIRLSALEASLGAVDPERDPASWAQRHAELQALELAHQARLAQIRGEAAVQSAGQMTAVWADMSSRLSGLWDSGVNAMMNGTLTWSGAVRAAGLEVVGWFSTQVVKPIVMSWLFGENAKTAATQAGTAQRLLVEGWAAIKSVAIWAASAVKKILIWAWEAAAAAFSAMASIPYVGPFLAVGAAAAAVTMVAGFAKNISSAEGGFDIPGGINPLTQLHQREMVLPQRYADVIRSLAERGGGGGEGLTVNVNHTINALDGRSLERVLVENSHSVAKAVNAAVRNFQLKLSD
jgi:hypothetical protein